MAGDGACGTEGFSANVYWDTNGTTTGAGGTSPSGTWDAATARWNTSSAGTGAVAAWAAGNAAFFSAGTDATGTYTVTVAGTHSIAGLTFEDGAVTLDGGTLNWTTAGNISVAASRTAIINSVLSGSVAVAKTSTGTLRLAAQPPTPCQRTLQSRRALWNWQNLRA
ncbi:hypothetical protein [Verrucomicrobium spinosum]|uniref:hypothetical protein n=1 Tax=Verrucomicrobium spinosum TaxID=2736 RepID=UPI00094647CC|nr:hypothetical protein [Verrucomicrobium spinosum]